MNREDVIREIVERDLQNLPLWEDAVRREADVLHAAGCNHFGVWETALEYAGVSPWRSLVKDPYSRERVLAKIRKICINANDMSAQRNRRRDRRLYEAARRHFGSWRRALRAAGIDLRHVRVPPKPSRLDREKILRQLRKRSQSDRPLTWAALCLENREFAVTLKHTFGSWREALVAAGLAAGKTVVPGGPRWNPERVIRVIKERQSQGKRMSYTAVREDDGPLCAAARRYFGGWSEALEAAGVEWEGRGRKPTGK